MPRGKPLEGAPGWRVIERPRPKRRRRIVLSVAVLAGLFLAVALSHRLVGSLANDRQPPPAGAIASAEAPTAEIVAQPPPTLAPPLRIFIHYPAGAGDAVPAMQLAAFLQVHRFEVADIRLVEATIDRPGVRYFFAGDGPQSRRLVDAISAFFPDRTPYEAADFSHVSSKPQRGDVEVWIPAGSQG